MNNHVLHMLRHWQPLKTELSWVLGVIYKTEGSCYRKAGAMMLISEQGHQLGVLSGGCLETDIHKKARRVMTDNAPRFATYDDEDEHDIAFQLGVGCGGIVHVALLPLSEENGYLALEALHGSLEHATPCNWHLDLGAVLQADVETVNQDDGLAVPPAAFTGRVGVDGKLCCRCVPPVHLLIVGAGMDAGNVATLADSLGWQVSVWDPRPGKQQGARSLKKAALVEAKAPADLQKWVSGHAVQAAVLMSHHRDIDAQALSALVPASLHYIAMLGPPHRREEIVALAGVDERSIDGRLFSPAGLNIGGELPESIALSVIAECHAALYKREGQSLSDGL